MMFRREEKGWLGIDIGTATVKVVQLARSEDRLRVLATAQVPRLSHVPPAGEEQHEPVWSVAGEIRAAVALAKDFRGRHAAASMPMGFCDVHQLGNLAVDEADVESEVRQAIETITQCSADHLEFDIWPAESVNQQRWNVLAVARPWADRVYRDVIQNGYACHTIDGVPQALARAVNLSSASDTVSPLAVLDWGFSQATFCLVAEGQPFYVRTLKDCSYQAALVEVADELGLTLDEASLLLEKHGARGLNTKSDDEAVTLIAELMASPLRQLEQELARTLAHVGFQYRSFAPRRLILFGGGALVSGVPRYLTRRLRLETQRWTFDPHSPTPARHDPLFGVALALSALAWEER